MGGAPRVGPLRIGTARPEVDAAPPWCHGCSVTLERYNDPLAVSEAPEGIGEYVASFAYDGHLVDVHVFRQGAELQAYVVKSGGVPVAIAQRVAREVLAQLEQPAAQVVYDGYSLGRSGSL